MNYQACLAAPFAVLGVRCTDDAVTGIDFLPLDTALIAPRARLSNMVCDALQQYLHDASCNFELPLMAVGTSFQCRVWEAMRCIPGGQTITYAELARQIDSGARAVANACGANPIPVIIPCHRVVAANGLGGFMRGREESSLDIKRWLLAHERSASGTA